MSKPKIVLLIVIAWLCTNCTQDKFPYQYSSRTDLFQCDVKNHLLFKEALYSFENDLRRYYSGSDSLENAYIVFINASKSGFVNHAKIASPHTIKVFRELSKMDDLFNTAGSLNQGFNYNHKIFSCIGKNIRNNNLKKTYVTLLENNSLSPRLMISTLRNNRNYDLTEDRALAMYISFDLFYHQMGHMFIPKEEY